jgi:cytidylate kinase
VCADFAERALRVAKNYGLTDKEANNLTKKTDKNRANYYNFYTGKDWGDPINYDLVINTTVLPPEKAASVIIAALG